MTTVNCVQFIDVSVERKVDYGTSTIRLRQKDNIIVIPKSVKEKLIEAIRLECGEYSDEG